MGKNKCLKKKKALLQPQESGLGLSVTCIHPAELRRVGIKCQPVGQAQVVLHENPPVCAIHVGSFNFGAISVPVGPIKVPGGGKGRERERVITKVDEKKFMKTTFKKPMMKTLAGVQTQNGI